MKSIENVWQLRLRSHTNVNVRFKAQRRCPIIALTACKDFDTTQKALKAGVEQVLSKPINSFDLSEVIRKFYFK